MDEIRQHHKPKYSRWAIAAYISVVVSISIVILWIFIFLNDRESGSQSGILSGALVIVLYILWFTVGFCSLCGFHDVTKSKGSKRGYIPIMVGIVWFVLGFLGITYSVIPIPRGPYPLRVPCMANLHQLSIGLMIYAAEKGNLPSSDTWFDDIKEFVGTGYDDCYKCPAIRQGDCHYAINENLSGVSLGRIKKPAEVVMIFESRQSGWNQHGGAELLAYEDHQLKDNRCQEMPKKRKKPIGSNIAFCDGNVEFVPVEEYDRLRWEIDVPNQ